MPWRRGSSSASSARGTCAFSAASSTRCTRNGWAAAAVRARTSTPAATLTDPADPGVYSWAMAPKPPSKDKVDPEVSFSWPGQQRRQDPGVLEARLAQRRQRQQPPEREQPKEPQPQREPQQQQQQRPSGRAQLPARREDVTPSGARD